MIQIDVGICYGMGTALALSHARHLIVAPESRGNSMPVGRPWCSLPLSSSPLWWS